MQPYLLVIVGPTAVGKTEIALRIAEQMHTVILSADARQFYRELTIGTAKPSPAELARVKHYFINSLSVTDTYTVADFETDALQVLDKIYATQSCAVLAGGSGLFVKALLEGLDAMPETDPSIREELTEQVKTEGLQGLVIQLQQLDPEFCAQADLNNTQRVLRALEVCLSTGKPFSSFRQGVKASRPFKVIKIGLERPRPELYARINQRVDLMMNTGLLEEVINLLPYQHTNALQTVGYTELFRYLSGVIALEEAIALIKQNSRRYAKRQLTWFRKDPEIAWFQADDFDGIYRYCRSKMATVPGSGT